MNQPHPAEASTEVGADDAPETLGGIVSLGVVVVVIALIAFAAVYFL